METRLGEGVALEGGPLPVRYLDYPPNLDIPVHLQIAASPPLLSLEARGDASWPSLAPAERCKQEWKVFYCGCRARVAEIGCNRLDCRNCQEFLRKRRADAIEQRMEAGRHGKPVIYTIFTVPPSSRRQAADVKAWGRWLRSLRKVMKKKFGLLYGVERVDPAGDEHPTLWHPHLNLLWVQRDGFRPYIDVDELRAEWARILKEPVVDVWTHYSSEERQLRHWYSYMGRTWADWRKSVPKHLTIRWVGKYPPRPKEGEPICDRCGERIDELGFRNSTREVAEYFCRAGPAACRAEIKRRRHVAHLSSQHSMGRLKE